MDTVNWCLMAVAFALGLVLTLAFMVRRVKREVPVNASGGGGAATAGLADTKTKAAEPDVDVADEAKTAKTAKAAAATGGGAAAATLVGGGATDDADSKSVAEEPYGPGSARLAAGAAAPSGWTIKGNEDSMLYHTTESPSYNRTIAELWFRDEESAENAGFNRWDSGKSQRERE